MAVEVTDKNIADVLKDNEISVIDFWAPWCGPCRMLTPIMDKLADDNPDVTIGKINIDLNPDSSLDFKIRAIPTIIFFKNGNMVTKVSGAQSPERLQSMINDLKNG